jgi:A1 cistron-splicing factor AAR2
VAGNGGLRRPWGSTGENLRMGNDEAVRRFKAGACVLALDFPAETEFGVDVRSWTVGPKFKGLKMVPGKLSQTYSL